MNYFEKTLAHLRLFGGVTALGLSLPTPQNASKWLDRIENELSPENLTCDGELRGAPLRAKQRELLDARATIHAMLGRDAAKTFTSTFPDEGAKDGLDFLSAIVGVTRRGRRRIEHPMIRAAKRQRTRERESKLVEAVYAGFREGARVLISNGVRGTIVKVNRTRVKVKGEDNRMWSVPPRCMTLLKVR